MALGAAALVAPGLADAAPRAGAQDLAGKGRDVAYTETEVRNLRVVRQMYEQVLMPLDASKAHLFIREDYIQHSPMAPTGRKAFEDFIAWARGASPGATHEVRRMFADGDHVIAHVHVVRQPGTRGYAVVDIFRLQDGLIAEHWDVNQEIPETPANTNGMF